MNPGVGVEKIAAVDEENPFSLLAGLLDKGRAPGQTAKQKVLSAAGLDFSENVRGENDGKVFSRPGIGGLRPAGNGGQKNEEKNSENLAQENLLKKDRSAERRQTNGLGFVFIQKPLDFLFLERLFPNWSCPRRRASGLLCPATNSVNWISAPAGIT
jgi:hypothetical protein